MVKPKASTMAQTGFSGREKSNIGAMKGESPTQVSMEAFQESSRSEIVDTGAKYHDYKSPVDQNTDGDENDETRPLRDRPRTLLNMLHLSLSVLVLFLNYFCAQYDKFILSYFQDSFSRSLNLSSTEYGVLSGYATGIVYALLALPIAFVADYLPSARVWTLTVASIWWSLCVVFQSLCHNFWQVLLARIGMGIGQSCVEAISVSLLSDLVEWRNVFLSSSCFYVGVYIGEAVSGQIATAFPNNESGWRIALRAIGITGIVLAVLLRLLVRDTVRQRSIVPVTPDFQQEGGRNVAASAQTRQKLRGALIDVRKTFSFVLRLRSFWILVLSAGFRQLAGNVFGYYMPSYLANTYPDKPNILSRYGIIVGVVGSVSVLGGGVLTSVLWSRTKLTPLYLTGVGGMISSLFVLLMIFSRDIAHGDQDRGIGILYGTMSIAYLTAETWLGAMNGLVALLLPSTYKTFGLAIWSTIQVLMYSAGPQIIGLALRNSAVGSPAYTKSTQVILAVIIPVCYWIAGIGFLLAVNPARKDLAGELRKANPSIHFKAGVWTFSIVLIAMVVALFVSSIVYSTI